MADRFTPGPWRLGKAGGVVADVPIEGGPRGSDDVAYYGGHLICESTTPANARLIIAAPKMYDLLRRLIEPGNSVPVGDVTGLLAGVDGQEEPPHE
jgi:hypothetical protein